VPIKQFFYMKTERNKIPDLSLDLIKRATAGEEEALLMLLRRYDADITHWATIEETNSEGRSIKRLDEDLKAEIQERYIRAIRNWRELI